MKNALLIVVIMLLFSISPATHAENPTYSELDQQMIEVLVLDPHQASAYVVVMEQQREAFLALKTHAWERELALYRETFTLLKPILSQQQLDEFVAIINSVIEEEEEDQFLAMEN